jgi:endonuclease/exonuclease/phosphatase family metal-dependent hydrolase
MKILTWNILASEWIKQSYYPKVDKSVVFNRKSRFAQICKILNEYDADIIMLQEVMKKEYMLLLSLFEKQYIISGLKKMSWYNKKSESGNVTLLKRSEFSDIHVNHRPQEYGLYTQCKYKGHSCDLFNIHLDDSSSQTRHKQWNNLHALCRGDCRAIVAGDFNQQYKSNSKLYNKPGFTTHNLCATYYIERKMNIDNILTSGFKKALGSKCQWYPKNIEEGLIEYGSDHMPVIIEVEPAA